MKRGDPGRLRTLIVDDERPARTRIRHLLSQEGDFEVVGEASDGNEAARLIEQLGPDLVFLDIRMPGKVGFEVLEAVESERRPWVVFVTAYDDHAVRAFEVFALDYLLKPFDEDRFRATLERVRRHLQLERDDELHRKLSHLLSEMRTHKEGFYAFARRLSRHHQEAFAGRVLAASRQAELQREAALSLDRQAEIEAADQQDFDSFLARYFAGL